MEESKGKKENGTDVNTYDGGVCRSVRGWKRLMTTELMGEMKKDEFDNGRSAQNHVRASERSRKEKRQDTKRKR